MFGENLQPENNFKLFSGCIIFRVNKQIKIVYFEFIKLKYQKLNLRREDRKFNKKSGLIC